MICMICMHGAMARVGDRCHHHSSHPHTECGEHLSSITSPHTTHNTLQWTVYNNSHITQNTQIVLPPILWNVEKNFCCRMCLDQVWKVPSYHFLKYFFLAEFRVVLKVSDWLTMSQLRQFVQEPESSRNAMLKNIENWLQMLFSVCGWDTDGAAEEEPHLDTCEYRHRVVNTVSLLSQPRPAEESLNLLIKFKIV